MDLLMVSRPHKANAPPPILQETAIVYTIRESPIPALIRRDKDTGFMKCLGSGNWLDPIH